MKFRVYIEKIVIECYEVEAKNERDARCVDYFLDGDFIFDTAKNEEIIEVEEMD